MTVFCDVLRLQHLYPGIQHDLNCKTWWYKGKEFFFVDDISKDLCVKCFMECSVPRGSCIDDCCFFQPKRGIDEYK